jgi:hypothetical protein
MTVVFWFKKTKPVAKLGRTACEPKNLLIRLRLDDVNVASEKLPFH